MNQQLTNDTANRNGWFFIVLLVGVILTGCEFRGLSTASFDGPVTLMPSTPADAVGPIGPAYIHVAEQYDQLDHSPLNSPDILPEPDPPYGASIAAYETPPE